MRDTPPLILLAAGGTGGHVFPAEALARELLGRGARVALVTDSRGHQFGGELSLPVYRLRACPLGKGLIRRALSIAIMGVGVAQALWLIHRQRPSAVVGFGGYPSVPILYAAVRSGVPIILHEQNAVLGRANRTMAPMAHTLCTAFPHVADVPVLSDTRLVPTGNPVRPAFAAHRGDPYPPLGKDDPIRLLVLGGSLGANVFSHVVPKALGLMPETLRSRMIVAQQCRAEDIETARAAFAAAGIVAEVSAFFKDVPERMATAHLIIGRAGGGAIAELAAIGRPSILVPFPHGHAGEQKANAAALADAGGAWLIPEEAFLPESLAMRLESLLALPATLAKTAAAARGWGSITAADALADCVYEAMGLPTPKTLAALSANPDRDGQESLLALATHEFYS
ncbi:MAG: UDP-N-acetylglucosamine--N-acetylmuramyl-(pentapeptide) pyrophosphoryl-undecaprenol N-acetylglucosamine transferase [Bdellovibrionales bacterium]|jgi:UDP-N-acetylglucosamine--N-acetylmuramyl-(pentapeptide) pyrophosphoryl-undecaprenol N-acetylglucosamine transferase